MQFSLSETFNIVTADAVNNNVPVVTSNEVTWISSLFKSSPTNSGKMLNTMHFAWLTKCIGLQFINKVLLYMYSWKSESVWLDYFTKESHYECDCDCEGNCDCGCGCQ